MISEAGQEELKSFQQIPEKLYKALASGGDFPVQAKVIFELRTLARDPSTQIERITECILREPTLGTRVLHLANSELPEDSDPVLTVSQAVTQLGLRKVAKLCSGMVLMERFIPAAKPGGVFAENLKKSVLTSVLTLSLASGTNEPREGLPEKAYLAGTLYMIGPLLLAYYFPQVYAAAEKRASARGYSLEQSLTEIVGTSPIELSLGIINSLTIPKYYNELLLEAFHIKQNGAEDDGPMKLSHALASAEQVATSIIDAHSMEELEQNMESFANNTGFTHSQLSTHILELPIVFTYHCRAIGMSFLSLPDYLADYSHDTLGTMRSDNVWEALVSPECRQYLDDLRQAVRNSETKSSIVVTALEALAYGLNFDRVMLLQANNENQTLEGKLALGAELNRATKNLLLPVDPNAEGQNAAQVAFLRGREVIGGSAIFEDGSESIAIPVGGDRRTTGVIYADRLSGGASRPVEEAEKSAIRAIAGILQVS